MKTIIALILLTISIEVKSQIISSSLISSGGGSFTQIYGKMDFAIGETIIETYKANNNYLCHGFIQGASTSLNSISKINEAKTKITLYPNPFNSELNINFTGTTTLKNACVDIYDILGKIVHSSSDLKKENSIILNHLSPGIYLAMIKTNNNTLETFRIEKLN